MKKVCYNNSMTEKGNTMAGLTSLPRKKNIKGQPHKLAYITEAESDLLKSMGGAGKPRKGTKGVPSYDFSDDDPEGQEAAAQEAADAADAAAAGIGGGRGGDPRGYGFDPEEAAEAARASSVKGFTEEEAAELADITDVRGLPSTLDLGSLADVDAYHEGFYDPVTGQTKSDVEYAMAILNELGQKGMNTTAQDLLDSRAYSGLGIPQMNQLEEDYNLNTFGLGYRGSFEARSPKGLSRAAYDPNSLTGAGTDEASDRKALFASFARANRGLTTVEAMAQYNATSPQDQQVSMSDVQSMGFDLNAAVGPQADFREAEAQRGFAQGLGMIGRSLAFGPIGVLSDIALSGRGEGYGKGVVGHVADMFEKVTGIDLPEAPDLGIPSFEEVALDVVGPAKDTMDPAAFGITGVTEQTIGPEAFGLADISPPTNEEIGFAGFNTVNDLSLGFDGSGQIAPPPVQRPVIKEKEEIIKTPAPRFPVRDTTPDSAIRTLARIYKDDQGNPDEQRARELLGIGIA